MDVFLTCTKLGNGKDTVFYLHVTISISIIIFSISIVYIYLTLSSTESEPSHLCYRLFAHRDPTFAEVKSGVLLMRADG